MTRLTDYAVGYLLLRLSGQNTAAFLSDCARRGIPQWDIKYKDGHVLLCSTVRGFFSMRNPARKYRCQVEVIRRRGLPFLLQRARRRLFFSLGAFLFAGLLWMLSGIVWQVEVEGSKQVESAAVLEIVRREGLYVGTWRRKVDTERVATALLREFPQLAWAGVRLKGSLAVVRLVDRAVVLPQLRLPGDIVAARSGVVTRLLAFSGEAKVRLGDTVAAGQVLLSGVTAPGGHASGLVEARVWYEAVGSMETVQVVPSATGRVAVREFLRLRDREIHLSGPREAPYALYEEATLQRNLLPGVEQVTVTYREMIRSYQVLSTSEAEIAAEQAAQSRMRVSLPSGVRILNSRTDVRWQEDRAAVYVRVMVETLEDIAQFVPRQ